MDTRNYRYRLPKELQEGCELFLAPIPGYNQDPGLSIWPDISGHGRHGVIHGATWTLGKWGWELRFDGVDDYVTTSFVVSASGTIAILTNVLDFDNYPVAWDFRTSGGSGSSFFISDSFVDEVASTVFINGVKSDNISIGKDSFIVSSNTPFNILSAVIGIHNDLSSAALCGSIPFFAIWSRALTEEQIKILNEFIEGTKR